MSGGQGPLTPRELEIIHLIAEGLSGKDMAKRLHRSYNTIHAHKGSIMHKIGCRNSVGIILYAIKEGIVTIARRKQGGDEDE